MSIDVRSVKRRSPLVLPVVLLAVFVMPISISGTAIALPAIAHDLGPNPGPLQWVINGFNAAFALFTLIWGPISDRIGHRGTFVIGVILILIASLLSAFAPSLLILDSGRLLAGAGGAAIFTGSSAILSNAFSDAERGRAFAFFGTTIGLGLALGPTISGLLVGGLGWRGVFVAFALVMVLALIGSAVLPKIHAHREAGQKSIDFTLLGNRRFLAFALVPVAAAVGYVTMLSYLPVALSAIHGLSAAAAGLFMLPMTIPVLVGPLLAAQLVQRVRWISPMTMIHLALFALVVGDLGLLLLGPSVSLGWLVAPMILLGFGFGFPIGLVDGEALASVPARNAGTAAGLLNFLRLGSEAVVVGIYATAITWLVGLSLSPAVAAHTAAGVPGNGAVYANGLRWILIVMALLVVVLWIIISALHRSSVIELRLTPDEERREVAEVAEKANELRVDPLA